MTDLRTDNAPPAPGLAELLKQTPQDPFVLAERIREARERASVGDPAVRDLHRVELRFLRAQAAQPGVDERVRDAVDLADRAVLRFELRTLRQAPTDDAAALFDLAELRAALRVRSLPERVEQVGAEIERRVAAIDIGAEVLEEARERYAALSTDEEDLPLPHRIALLEETASVITRLGRRSERRSLLRLGRRLDRLACDRTLAHRVEGMLTRRGARWLETTSLLLLLVLLVLLAVESVFDLSPATAKALLSVDIFVCLFFVAEFLFKLALAPARVSWFLRNVVTDLLPALPAALLFLNVPHIPAPDDTIWVRLLRFLRIAYFARYIQALRPLLRLFRLMLFMVRGLDFVVARFSWLLNRDFVFFEPRRHGVDAEDREELRSLAFRALRREHVLLSEVPPEQRYAVVAARAAHLDTMLADVPETALASAPPTLVKNKVLAAREVPVEQVIDLLHGLRPEALGLYMPQQDVAALDRVARILNAPVVRLVPFVRKLSSPRLADSPEERVVDLGRRVADRLETWRDRVLYFADMHGILTGPQILDRIASALVLATKRPAVRLLLFGGLFVLVRLLFTNAPVLGPFLERFVATPLLVLGGVCLALLTLGRWLKRIAGEASESLRRTSEAHFLGLLELAKCRDEGDDIRFLAQRVFRWELPDSEAQWALSTQVTAIRSGRLGPHEATPLSVRFDAHRAALLYLHFLDGAILHQNDIKTSQQLLANLSLDNIRNLYLGHGKKDGKRLRRLSLEDGGMLGGPYMWFRCITDSIALESAKRVVDYNRECMSLAQRACAPEAACERMAHWLRLRRDEVSGRRLDSPEMPSAGEGYVTTEFNALDFLMVDADRQAHLRTEFGDEVVDLLVQDRQRMVREIFGTGPLEEMPRSQRTLNVHRFYQRRLSGGRILLLPLYWLGLLGRLLRLGISKTIQIVREILAPETALGRHRRGQATFSAALRKIHRMKAPGLLEAMRTRTRFDPAYCGAPSSWSVDAVLEERSELIRDMDFLDLREREREPLRALAESMRRRVEQGHLLLRALPPLVPGASELDLRLVERAVTIVYATDRLQLRTLLRAEPWFERALRRYESKENRVHASLALGFAAWILRGFRRHPVSHWLRTHLPERRVSRRARAKLCAAHSLGDRQVRRTVAAWSALPAGVTPRDRAHEIALQIAANHQQISRELAALRAVQSLSVLDVRNYRRLVFDAGGYAELGEEPEQATALP